MLCARSCAANNLGTGSIDQRSAAPGRLVADAQLFVAHAGREQEAARNRLMLGMSVPLPLFDRNLGNERAALSRRDKAEAEAHATALHQRAELLSARQRWLTASQVSELLREQVLPGAQTAYAAATKGFSLGKFSYLEALDAQRTLLEARTQYLDAVAEAYGAASEVERLIGAPLFGAAAATASIAPATPGMPAMPAMPATSAIPNAAATQAAPASPTPFTLTPGAQDHDAPQ